MDVLKTTIFSCLGVLLVCCASAAVNNTVNNTPRRFPDSFQFGVATASYQVEGAWDEDGKSPSIWDHLTHTNSCAIANCNNGDIAANSYHQHRRDVEMMRELGVDFYRFSLSWTRILPTGFSNEINYSGLQYYNVLDDEMLKYNIQPVITLYHFDLPQSLQDLGGFTNPFFVEWFVDYARVAFELFGDRVKTWITFNEPMQICYVGYGIRWFAPLVNVGGIADYMCSRNILIAHAAAWHMYNEEFKPFQHGEAGISIDIEWHEPMSHSVQDREATEVFRLFEWGQYVDPIFSASGDYPEVMKQKIAARSAEQGFPRSRLPAFSQQEVDYIKGTFDFLGVNTYSTQFVYTNESIAAMFAIPSFRNDVNATSILNPGQDQRSWITETPDALYNVLTLIRDKYNNPKVYITENGFSSAKVLEDDSRASFFRAYLNSLLNAIEEGCNVQKYTAWSLMDNFEWMNGYTDKFGLYKVDFEDPGRKRTARKSALVYKEILRSRQVDFSYESVELHIAIDEGH